MKRLRIGIFSAAAVFWLTTVASAAQFTVGAGSSMDLGTGLPASSCEFIFSILRTNVS